MKYVIMRYKTSENSKLVVETPIIFANNLVHSFVADYAVQLLKAHGFAGIEPVAAGVYTPLDSSCGGESNTLGLGSRDEDTEFIRMYDYLGGVVS